MRCISYEDRWAKGRTAVGGLVTLDAVGRGQVGVGDVHDIGVAWIGRHVRAVGGGNVDGRAPGNSVIGGLVEICDRRAGVEDDGIDRPLRAISDTGIATGPSGDRGIKRTPVS